MTTVKIRIDHGSSIPGARWCTPIDWVPANVLDGSQWDGEGSWWDDNEETAGIVYFGPGAMGEIVEVHLSDLRLASCFDCRIIGAVELVDYP